MVDFTKPVQTRDGRKVRVVCTNLKSTRPIIAAIENYMGEEDVHYYDLKGRTSANAEYCLDLVNPTIKKKGWINIYNDAASNIITCIEIEWEEPA